MSKNTKLWTAGTLKSRGWTEELIASLLPKPQRLYRNGRRVRVRIKFTIEEVLT